MDRPVVVHLVKVGGSAPIPLRKPDADRLLKTGRYVLVDLPVRPEVTKLPEPMKEEPVREEPVAVAPVAPPAEEKAARGGARAKLPTPIEPVAPAKFGEEHED